MERWLFKRLLMGLGKRIDLDQSFPCATRAAAQDVAAMGVRVNAIAPGAVDTPMHADHRAKLFEYEK